MKQTKLNKMENIEKEVSNLSEAEAKDMLIDILTSQEETFTVVKWPESQEYMEKEWFKEEAVLDISCIYGPSAYFIPTNRL